MASSSSAQENSISARPNMIVVTVGESASSSRAVRVVCSSESSREAARWPWCTRVLPSLGLTGLIGLVRLIGLLVG